MDPGLLQPPTTSRGWHVSLQTDSCSRMSKVSSGNSCKLHWIKSRTSRICRPCLFVFYMRWKWRKKIPVKKLGSSPMSPENTLSKLKFTLIVSHCRLFFESVFRIETFWHCLFLQFLILAVQPDFPKCRHAAINRITGNRGYFPEKIFGIGKLVTCILDRSHS